MLRLRTLGGISVLDARGDPLPRATAYHRPLALMAILAAGRPSGVSRDKLVGLLWPDAPSDRARHALTQTLYATRRALGVNDLFLLEGSIRLNPCCISSDVGDLERALDAGDLELATSFYDGPFLDGFFVSGASEFEPWASARRSQLEDRVMVALDQLAGDAERSNDLSRALRFRRRMVTIRPVDTLHSAALVTLLARMGNRSEALLHARAHAEVVRKELDLGPDPSLTALVDSLRRQARSRGALTKAATESATLVEVEPDIPPALAISRWPQLRALAVGVSVVVLGVAGALRHSSGTQATRRLPTTSDLGDRSLIVAPFNVSGASPSAAYLGNAVVQLLGHGLDGDSNASAADAASVLAAWRSSGFDRTPDVPRDSVLRLARAFGAGRVVVGSVVGSRADVVLNAKVLVVSTGQIVARASVEGPANRIAPMITTLAAKLLVRDAGDSEPIATEASRSLRALQRYVAGRLADHRGDPAGSVRDYQDALAFDSTFATAALRLAIAADRSGNADLEADALARAWGHRESLSKPERALLVSFVGPRYPSPSSVPEQLDAWERIARDDARSPSTWQQLAAHLFHEGSRLGAPTAAQQAVAAIDRALALRRDYEPAIRLRSAMRQDGDGPAADALDTLDDADLTAVRAVAMSSVWRGTRIDDGVRAISLLDSKATTTSERVDAILAEHSLALNQGRPADALASTERLQRLRPDSHAHLRLRVLDALYGGGDTAAAASAVSDLAPLRDVAFEEFPLEQRRRGADACVAAQWRLAHADTTHVRGAINLLRTAYMRREPSLVSAPPAICAELLDVSLAVVTNQPDALSRLQRVDSLMLTPAVAGNAASYAHLLLSRLYGRLGHPRRALAAIRKRDEMLGWPAYLAATWREEWRLAIAAGDVDGASVAEHKYVAWRAGHSP